MGTFHRVLQHSRVKKICEIPSYVFSFHSKNGRTDFFIRASPLPLILHYDHMASSNAPQTLMQSISLERTCRFFSTSKVWRCIEARCASLRYSAILFRPKNANVKQFSTWHAHAVCFFTDMLQVSIAFPSPCFFSL